MNNTALKNAKTIVEVVDGDDRAVYCVVKTDDGVYHVIADGVSRHTPCSADDAMRALANYLQSAVFELHRIKYPEG